MSAYLTVSRFKLLSTIPSSFVDSVELTEPGYVPAQLTYWSDWIDSQLRKRYAAPFVDPIPGAVEGWLARLVTVRVWTKRGVDPSDAQWLEVKGDDEAARKEIKEAANCVDGLFDLPLRANTVDSGIVKQFPRGYSEASPYVWTSQQRERGTQEDEAGHGSEV